MEAKMVTQDEETLEAAAHFRAMLDMEKRILKVMWIRLSRLCVDPAYQRPEIPEWKLLEMVYAFDWRAFGVVSAARRKDGTFLIIDAQQRCAALRMMADFAALDGRKAPDPLVLCVVFDSDGRKSEAAVFHTINGKRTPLKPHEDFKSAVLALEDPQTRIAKCLATLGMSVGTPSSKTPNTIGFTNALVRTWLDNAKACVRALRIQRTIIGPNGVMIKPLHKGLWHILSNIGPLSAKEIAHLRTSGKEAICAAISGVQKTNGVTGRPHATDCAEGILALLGRPSGLKRGRIMVCKAA